MSTFVQVADTDVVRCSDVQVEPLPGTAKTERTYVIFEWPQGWSRDVLDGDTFGPELTAKLKKKLKGMAGLQLIRRPGREGRQINDHDLYLVFADQGSTEKLVVDRPEAILDLDLSGPGRNGAQAYDGPLVLVCTHGRRDVCCAIKGRPLAAELARRFPAAGVWETSHTKGHRFSPSLLLMPWGYSFGRLNEPASVELVESALRGDYFYPGNRGRGLYGPRGQVAELAVARQLLEAGEGLRFGELEVTEDGDATPVVTHADGRVWEVRLTRQEVGGIVSSCGDAPKSGQAWVADSVLAR